MEKRKGSFDRYGRPVRLEWLVNAVVDTDSVSFAAKLETVLNSRTEGGYQLVHMLSRSADDGLVITFQRATFLDVESGPVPQGAGSTGENDELH